MATETTFRPHVDQENVGLLNGTKGGNTQGRTFGTAKSFQSNIVPLTTPRRALGDVGNTLQPSGATTKRGLGLKSNQLKSCNKTPGASKFYQGTPVNKGLPLLQQISKAGTRQSAKKKQAFQVKTAEKPRVKKEQDLQKEVMYPFTDKEDVIPRSNYVSTILRNVGTLYHGCLRQPESFPDSNANNVSSLIHLETETRPLRHDDKFLEALPFEGELDSISQSFCTLDAPGIDLPPVDIDSLGLGLP